MTAQRIRGTALQALWCVLSAGQGRAGLLAEGLREACLRALVDFNLQISGIKLAIFLLLFL